MQNCEQSNLTVSPNYHLQPNLLSRPNRILGQAFANPLVIHEVDALNEEEVVEVFEQEQDVEKKSGLG